MTYKTDGVYQAVLWSLRDNFGPIWMDASQVDIISTAVEAVRKFDRKRRK